jgi:hypothetical protein
MRTAARVADRHPAQFRCDPACRLKLNPRRFFRSADTLVHDACFSRLVSSSRRTQQGSAGNTDFDAPILRQFVTQAMIKEPISFGISLPKLHKLGFSALFRVDARL